MAKKIKARQKKSKSAINNIRLMAMDVDGVLTSGEIIVLQSGEEIKFWNAKDRFLLAMMRNGAVSMRTAWITGRKSTAVEWSAKDLGINHLVQGSKDKKAALEEILKKENLSLEQVAYIGDDLIDLPVLKAVAFSACPHDAVSDVLNTVDYVSPFGGGKGVVRDVLEYVLRRQGQWKNLLHRFLN